MKHIFYFSIALVLAFFSISLEGACDHSLSRTENDLGPSFRFDLWPSLITDNAAFAMLGEIGNKNFRSNGTLGYKVNDCHFFKISGEWLGQKLGYRFATGKVHRWMHQQAFGIKYRYGLNTCWLQGIELGSTYSYAQGRSLKNEECFYPTERLIRRHIAGSSAYNFNLGTTILPWCNASFLVALEYDHVSYRRKFHSNKIVSGLGASFDFYQILPCGFSFDLKADVRRAFNYVEGLLSWCKPLRKGLFTVGVFGSYNRGKQHLPNSANFGLELGFSFGGVCSQSACCENLVVDCCFVSWMADPAVKMPQVLAIADQQIIEIPLPPCIPPTSTTIPDQTVDFDTVINFNVAPFFNSQGEVITFSATGLPAPVVINPTTGVISGLNPATDTEIDAAVTVTGTTRCGSTSQSFTIIFLQSPG